MKPTFVLPAVFAAAAIAQPHNINRRRQARNVVAEVEKRALHTEWVIKTAWVTHTEYVDGTTTITVDAQATQVSNDDDDDDGNIETGKDAQFFETAVQESAPEPTFAAAAAPEPVAITPEPTAEAVAVSPPASAEPVDVAQEVPAAGRQAASSASSDPNPPAGRVGELTFFDLGLGACGFNDAGKDYSEYYVAVSAEVMGERSNDNPYCGKTITVIANGMSVVATVRDKCADCAPGHIDGTRKLFLDLSGDLGIGRMPVEWYFNTD